MKSKRRKIRFFSSNLGQTHIEVVLSFVIFVTFMMFLYIIIILPSQTQNNEQSIINLVMNEITGQNYMNNFTTVSISISGNRGNPCITGNINLPYSNNLMIKNESGTVMNYSNNGQITLQVSQTYTGILKAYYGTNIDRSPSYPNPPSCDSVVFYINYIKNENITSQYKLGQLINSYTIDYNSLKNSLGIPNNNNFWISFNYSNGTIISPATINTPLVNVYSSQIPIEYLDNNATEQVGIFTLEIW